MYVIREQVYKRLDWYYQRAPVSPVFNGHCYFHISILTTEDCSNMGELNWSSAEWHLHCSSLKASYGAGGLVLAWAGVLPSLAPASILARTVMETDSSLAGTSLCWAAINSFQGEIDHIEVAETKVMQSCACLLFPLHSYKSVFVYLNDCTVIQLLLTFITKRDQ